MNQQPINFKFYATLLDAFAWYLNSESEEALQEFLNKINRVPFTSEAAEKGTAFNDLVDLLKSGELDSQVSIETKKETEFYRFRGFDFKKQVVDRFVDMFRHAHHQVYVEAVLPTSKGNVLLYGYIDELAGFMSDIKCTSNYDFPKYLHNWQHIVYPYCMKEHGMDIPEFRYDVTDYSNLYQESYTYDESKDLPRLISFCERLIDFIELQREKITDRKIFALDPLPVEEQTPIAQEA